MQEKLDPILSEKDLAKWLDTSRPTLQRQRSDGSGPPFVQLSERRIGYRKSAVEQWLAARTINRIGEPVTAKPPKPAEQSTISEADTTAKLNVSSHRKRKKFGVSTFETD